MRLLLAILLAPTVAVVVVRGVADNPLAMGLAVGFTAPVCLAVVALASRPKPPLRRADPAKIARLEEELGFRERTPHWSEMGPSEAPTTIDRSWPCVVDDQFAEDCEGPHVETFGGTRRVCLRTRPPTFHGAPTFGHKIEGP